jgi:hypothetical protein
MGAEVEQEVPATRALRLITSDDPRSARLETFCDELIRRRPDMDLRRVHERGTSPPRLVLPGGVRYIGVPEGQETAPFEDAVSGRLPPPPQRLSERLSSLRLQAGLSLYVSSRCTFCPLAVRSIVPLAAAQPRLRLTIVDAELFPELAAGDHVLSLPTLVIDGRLRWSGTIDADEVVDLLAAEDPAAIGPVALEMMLKEGRARELASMMRERGRVFPALFELLSHPEWPVRLGAMVAAEELAAIAPDLVQTMSEQVWNRFGASSDPAKGDLLYMLGELGCEEDIPEIRSAVGDQDPADVREAAEEAIEKIKERFKC